MKTKKLIAEDLTEYLKENPTVCADISNNVGNHPFIRYHPDTNEWHIANFEHQNKVQGFSIPENKVTHMIKENPTQLIPQTNAYKWSPAEKTIWEHANEQDVFTDLTRCFWCGYSTRMRSLSLYETTENGETHLCDECVESWEKDGQIVTQLENKKQIHDS